MEFFKASTQHCDSDWSGTAAADIDGITAVEDHIVKIGQKFAGSLIAISATVVEKHNGSCGNVNVRAFFHEGQDYDSIKHELEVTDGPIRVSENRFTMTLEEFFGLFKDSEIVLTLPGLGLEDRQPDVVHET
ncbi:MAG: hypothetical protein ABR924_09430 [Terracidiphilus sp.]